MMHVFLTNNRVELVRRCRVKVASRPARKATALQLKNGVPMFLDQLIRTLQAEQTARPMEGSRISGSSDGGGSPSEIGQSAAQHAQELLKLGFSISQVVHDYGDICQSITDLAYERDAPFTIDEFRTLNRCLDNAIADAVTEFSYQRDFEVTDKNAIEMHKQLGFFAQELSDFLQPAMLAFAAAKTGNLGLSGATGSILERSLNGLRDLINQSLEEARKASRDSGPQKVFSVAEFIDEVRYASELAALIRGCVLTVSAVDPGLAFSADRDQLYEAVTSLIQNAFKFTHHHTGVTLDAYALSDRILIDVTDHCGGLPPGDLERLFLPFTQNTIDNNGLGGLGLGLPVARHEIEANDGTLTVRNVPGTGCIFTISLPRHELPAGAA